MPHLLLIGDCTLATSYMPDHFRNERLLADKLRELYPKDQIVVINEGLDGEHVLGFLRRYERTLGRVPPPEYVLIRFGVNDRKAYGVEGFREHLGVLCARLRADFPDVRILLETGIFVDYPQHYEFDRNSILEPVYDVIRATASSNGLPVVDIYRRMQHETAAGNWDLRVRGYGVVDDEIPVLGAGQDHLHAGDVRWWTNIHPNPRGISVIVDEEVAVIRRHWPETLTQRRKDAKD